MLFRTANLSQLGEFDAIIDVRTPAEFADDHIPGAINCPVLSDEERIAVGTLYKQVSPFEARKLGAALVAKNIARHLETRFCRHPKSWRPLIYCWRGGQRSGAMSIILAQIGWAAHKLEGGYKTYRRNVLEQLEALPQYLTFRVICGPTGSGKSRLLGALAEGGQPGDGQLIKSTNKQYPVRPKLVEGLSGSTGSPRTDFNLFNDRTNNNKPQILDLEGLAQHRGSVLGKIPQQPQPSQKRFESMLLQALQDFDPERPVYVESESNKIGSITLPPALVTAMHAGACLLLETPLAMRVAALQQDYRHYLDDPEALIAQLQVLHPFHGGKQLEHWNELIRAGNFAVLVEELLTLHYDPGYFRALSKHYAHLPDARRIAPENLSMNALRAVAAQLIEE